MTSAYAPTRSRRLGALGWLSVAALALWLLSLPFDLTVLVPASAYGPVGDGSSSGYEHLRAFGVANGSLVERSCHRLDHAGLAFHVRLAGLRLWPYRDGHWPTRTLGVPLFWVAAVFLCGELFLQYCRAGRGSQPRLRFPA